MPREIHVSVAAEAHGFGFQPSHLFFKTRPAFQRDSSARIDHSVPGEAVFWGRRVENPGDLARGPFVPGQGGDLAVGRDSSLRDRSYRVFDLSSKPRARL